jgi:hypothetical protein
VFMATAAIFVAAATLRPWFMRRLGAHTGTAAMSPPESRRSDS